MNPSITVDNLLDLAPTAWSHGNVDLLDAIELVARHMADRGVTALVHPGGCAPVAVREGARPVAGALSLKEAERRVFAALRLRETARMFQHAAFPTPLVTTMRTA